MSVDYSSTLNLPKTDFPMRANLPAREPELLKKWQEEDLYGKLMEKNADKPSFILHDGPPYANGDIHAGHMLDKILKDIVIRFKNMDGYRAPYVPGWDTHGLPIEQQAIKKLGINRHEAGPIKFREACRDFALKYVANQKEQFKRLGGIANWDHPYMTMLPEFEAAQIKIFGEMAKKGYIYKGLKPVYWCPKCETALAEAEIEYAEDKTNSIFVKFLTTEDFGKFDGLGKVYFVIWTTTTWTLPGNVAICLNPDFEYSLVRVAEDETYVLATELVDSVCQSAGIENYEIVGSFKGRDLEMMRARHPFIERDSLVILGDHVTLEAGTGCVHTAPGHGMEDFVACQNYDVPTIVPVDARGYLNEEAGEFAGLYYEESNAKIIEKLKEVNALLAIKEIIHQYPHCWRCNDPIVYRATEQWFASIEGFRDEALEQIKTVNWIPKWGEEKITNMVKDRNDWCISRQRIWGVPIPIFYCKECGKELINDATIHAVSDLFAKEGSDAWWKYDANEILPEGTKCSCGCSEFTKEKDIMDVWFDSGSSHAAVLENWDELSWPADLYSEGSDQYRGWFQSSLLTSVAARGVAPYKAVVTHGFVVDAEGRKMSKSKGNGVDPMKLVQEYGADVLRLWVVSADYKSDIRISKEILKQMSESYRKIRNTARFILGNIHDFDPEKDKVAYAELQEIDKYILMRLNDVIEKCIAAYRSYDYHIIYHTLHNFCVVDLSNLYLDIIKDRLYTQKANSVARRAAQTAMFEILDALVRLLAPTLAFTAEEIWQFMPHDSACDKESVMFNSMPTVKAEYNDEALAAKWEQLIAVKADVSKALELARTEKIIGHSLGAKVTVFADGKNLELLKDLEEDLVTYFIVSAVEVKEKSKADSAALDGDSGVKVSVVAAPGEKCDRCWMVSESVGTVEGHETLCKRCASQIQ